jgi:hypothetical protein
MHYFSYYLMIGLVTALVIRHFIALEEYKEQPLFFVFDLVFWPMSVTKIIREAVSFFVLSDDDEGI